MADVIYNRFKMGLLQGDFDFLDAGDDIKVALTTSSYSPDVDAHEDFADITNEVPGTGNYTSGGQSVANQTVTQDDTDDEGVFDGDDISWANSTIANARYGIIYQDTGTPATSLLIAALDFVSDQSTSNTEFKITWNAEGIVNLT